MSVVIPPGFASASVEMRASGDPDPWYITFGVDVSVAAGDTEAVFDTISDAWTNSFGPNLAIGMATTAYTLTIGSDGPDNLILRRDVNQPGTSDTGKLPQNCALLVRKVSALGGRKNRGRFFVPGVLNEGQVDNVGVIAPALVDAFNVASALMLSNLELGGATSSTPAPMVILHNPGLGSLPVPTPVTDLSVSPVIATQRRRLR